MRRVKAGRVVFGLLATIGLAGSAAAQEKTGAPIPANDRARVLGVARQIMSAARFCTLVTIGDGGQPQARVVDPLEPDATFAVHFATNPRSRKVAEIAKDPRVTLLYLDAARSAYVTMIGRAIEIKDASKGERRKKDWDAFFPREKPETYSLYRIVPTRLEVVSAKDGIGGDPATWRPIRRICSVSCCCVPIGRRARMPFSQMLSAALK